MKQIYGENTDSRFDRPGLLPVCHRYFWVIGYFRVPIGYLVGYPAEILLSTLTMRGTNQISDRVFLQIPTIFLGSLVGKIAEHLETCLTFPLDGQLLC